MSAPTKVTPGAWLSFETKETVNVLAVADHSVTGEKLVIYRQGVAVVAEPLDKFTDAATLMDESIPPSQRERAPRFTKVDAEGADQ